MNKIIMTVGLFALTSSAFSQDYVKNSENSEYKLKEIAHLDATPVQSQGYTGTCWSFSALSFFESEMIRKGNGTPASLSEMYVVRKSYEGKAEKYIRMDGKINFSEGGAFHDIPWVIRNHGLVPYEVYMGKATEEDRYNHSEFFSGIEGYVKGILGHVGNAGSGGISPNWKAGLNGILDAYIGPDPREFKYEGKSYTPMSYAKSTGLDMDDYVSLTSFTNHPMNEQCMLAIQDNWAWGTSYNVSLDDLMMVAEEALKNGYSLAWGADVSEKGFSFREGLAIVPADPNTIQVRGRDNKNFSDAGADKISNAFVTPVEEMDITAEYRQLGYDNKTTTDDHGMHITGLYEGENGTKYFLVKNSWGTGNYPEGYLYVSEAYFKHKTINIYLHKDGIPFKMKKKLEMK